MRLTDDRQSPEATAVSIRIARSSLARAQCCPRCAQSWRCHQKFPCGTLKVAGIYVFILKYSFQYGTCGFLTGRTAASLMPEADVTSSVVVSRVIPLGSGPGPRVPEGDSEVRFPLRLAQWLVSSAHRCRWNTREITCSEVRSPKKTRSSFSETGVLGGCRHRCLGSRYPGNLMQLGLPLWSSRDTGKSPAVLGVCLRGPPFPHHCPPPCAVSTPCVTLGRVS